VHLLVFHINKVALLLLVSWNETEPSGGCNQAEFILLAGFVAFQKHLMSCDFFSESHAT